MSQYSYKGTLFQSTLPRRERHTSFFSPFRIILFQSTLPRRERPMSFMTFPVSPIRFNPRSHEGSDDHRQRRNIEVREFQSTLPRRERQKRSHKQGMTWMFQSTLPRRERLYTLLYRSDHPCFNPRSHEGSDVLIVVCFFYFKSFNPRSHEGSDLPCCPRVLLSHVSIHAPTKGATEKELYPAAFADVSIHAPTKGATCSYSSGDGSFDVSIHAPTKGATYCSRLAIPSRSVSIHAPTKGATAFNSDFNFNLYVSIHAPTKGATNRKHFSTDSGRFQSTLPRRERPKRIDLTGKTFGFNPRSHEGSDGITMGGAWKFFRFQSTLPRRERQELTERED